MSDDKQQHWRIAHSEERGGLVLQVDTEWLAQKIVGYIADTSKQIREAFSAH